MTFLFAAGAAQSFVVVLCLAAIVFFARWAHDHWREHERRQRPYARDAVRLSLTADYDSAVKQTQEFYGGSDSLTANGSRFRGEGQFDFAYIVTAGQGDAKPELETYAYADAGKRELLRRKFSTAYGTPLTVEDVAPDGDDRALLLAGLRPPSSDTESGWRRLFER